MSVLAGVGVAVTRAGDGPGRLGDLLSRAGATVVHWPCIRYEEPEDDAPVRAALERLDSYDWLVVTSPRAARVWLSRLEGAGRAAAAGPGATGLPRTAAVGPATARVLREAGRPVDRVADEYSAAGVVEAFRAAGDAAGSRILFPGSDLASDDLPSGLRALGATVDRVVTYRTVPSPPEPAAVTRAAARGTVRVVTFTSPSTVEGFFAGLDPRSAARVTESLGAAAIGPTTAEALDAAGWTALTAAKASLEALVEAAARAAALPTGAGP